MSITRFYLLCEPEGNQCIADMNEAAPYSVEKIPCPIERGHARGRRNSPLDTVVPCDPAPDVVFTWMSECLIQESVRLIFESEGLTGFSTLPARAKIKKTGASIPVHELAVTGWGGMAPEATGIREVERCPDCGHLVYSRLEAPGKVDRHSQLGRIRFFHNIAASAISLCI
jgi:hypothetical protein